MKRRPLLRRHRDHSQSSSVRPRSLVSEAPLISHHFLKARLSPVARSTESIGGILVRRQALDTVLPRSPAESLYAENSDREMKKALQQAQRAADESTPSHPSRHKNHSKKTLFRAKKVRRVFPSVVLSPVKVRRHETSTPNLSAETTAEDPHSLLGDYISEVNHLRKLKRNVSNGVLTRFPKVNRSHRRMDYKGVMQGDYGREDWMQSYLSRMQGVIKELDRSLERYRGS